MDAALTDRQDITEAAMSEALHHATRRGFYRSRLRQRWLDVQDRIFDPKITPERKAKIQRILDKLDAKISAISVELAGEQQLDPGQ